MKTPDLSGRILAELGRRHLLAEDGVTTIFGKPAVREVPPATEGGPEALSCATTPQKQLVSLAFATPWTGGNTCAAWIEQVYARMGFGVVTGDAYELCQGYCARTELSDLKVGMVVGVEHHPYGADGLTFGHVGLYIGDGKIRDASDVGLRCVPLSAWLSIYGVMDDPRWGWLGSVALDRAQRTW